MYTVHNIGTIKSIGVDVTWDEAGNDLCTEIDWGTIAPGATYGTSVYIRNTKNTDITLAMMTDEWNPIYANETLSVDWNYTGVTLLENMAIPIQIQLTVAGETNVTNFSFDIIIVAYEVVSPPVVTGISVLPNPATLGQDVTCTAAVTSEVAYTVTWYVTDDTGTWAMGTTNPWTHTFPDANERTIYAVAANSAGTSSPSASIVLTFTT